MEVRRLRTLPLETFKTLNDRNPVFMKNLFSKRVVSKREKIDLEAPNRNTVKYLDKSIRSLEPHTWNENSYVKFREYLNTWYGPKMYLQFVILH